MKERRGGRGTGSKWSVRKATASREGRNGSDKSRRAVVEPEEGRRVKKGNPRGTSVLCVWGVSRGLGGGEIDHNQHGVGKEKNTKKKQCEKRGKGPTRFGGGQACPKSKKRGTAGSKEQGALIVIRDQGITRKASDIQNRKEVDVTCSTQGNRAYF